MGLTADLCGNGMVLDKFVLEATNVVQHIFNVVDLGKGVDKDCAKMVAAVQFGNVEKSSSLLFGRFAHPAVHAVHIAFICSWYWLEPETDDG